MKNKGRKGKMHMVSIDLRSEHVCNKLDLDGALYQYLSNRDIVYIRKAITNSCS